MSTISLRLPDSLHNMCADWPKKRVSLSIN